MADLGAVLEQTDHVFFNFRLPPDALTTPAGIPFDGLEVKVVLGIHPKFRSVNWQPVDFNGKTVATAAIPTDILFPGTAGDSVVTISHAEADGTRISLLGPSDNDIQLEAFPNALWQPSATASVTGVAVDVAAGHQARPSGVSTGS